jgi:nitrate/TMAO reductase-like tetraheme cytochrome c subunit
VRAFIERYSRPIKILVQIGILAIILVAVGSIAFIEYSAQPSFCKRCHIMEPYYESWATSSHNEVPCIKCHYAPGIKAEAMGKLQAANQVVKYVTGAYGMKPWAEIEDAACLRSGCHVEARLESEVLYKGIRFNHAQHLGELRRGKQLRCTSCHSQIVQGEHVRVTEAPCYLCHFKGRERDEPVAGCVGCHAMPPDVVSPAGFELDHEQYVRDLVPCLSCHEQVTEGSGLADEQRCFNCHNEPERLELFDNTTLVHRVHIADRNIECTQCHVPIEHRVVSRAATFELDCRACHRGTHEQQQRLYAGTGGHGTENVPSAMYLARVSCQSCHRLPQTLNGHEQVEVAGEASCMSCHGIRYANILPGWQREMERRVRRAGQVVETVRRLLSGAPVRAREPADSILRLAEENIDLVRVGGGAHNIAYSDRLLRAGLELAREAVRVGRLTYEVSEKDLGPPVSGNACLQCHLGIEGTTVRFQGVDFPHERHVLDGEMECSTCHSSLEEHGGTLLTAQSDCASCHHQPESTCLSCHSDGAITKHDRAFAHLECGQCHGESLQAIVELSRNVCTVCHVDRIEHNAPLECKLCHEVT